MHMRTHPLHTHTHTHAHTHTYTRTITHTHRTQHQPGRLHAHPRRRCRCCCSRWCVPPLSPNPLSSTRLWATNPLLLFLRSSLYYTPSSHRCELHSSTSEWHLCVLFADFPFHNHVHASLTLCSRLSHSEFTPLPL